MLAAGVAVFSFAGGNISSQSKAKTQEAKAAVVLFGNALLFVTLCCDALLGNFQEKVMRENNVSPLRMMLLQALFGSCLALGCAVASGELSEGAEIMRGPYGEHLGRTFALYAACLLSGETRFLRSSPHFRSTAHDGARRQRRLGLSSFLVCCCCSGRACAGTVAVLSLVEEFGAAAAVVVTLIRKCTSMMLSYAIWPKPLSSLHIWGAGLVFLSPIVHGWMKPKKKAKSAAGGGGDARHANAPGGAVVGGVGSGGLGGGAEEALGSLELGRAGPGIGVAGAAAGHVGPPPSMTAVGEGGMPV